MEALYHETNHLLQEVTTKDLVLYENTKMSEIRSVATLIEQKLDAIQKNCNQLDILLNKEPPQRRHNAKYKFDQLKYDFHHVWNSFRMLEKRTYARIKEEEDREALLSHRFSTNEHQTETAVNLDQETQYRSRLQDTNRNVDEMLSVSSTILSNLKGQGSVLKSAHKKVLDLAGTLGLSNSLMRLIERRSIEDKYILITGIVVVLILFYLSLKYI